MKVRRSGVPRLLQNRVPWWCVLGVALAVAAAARWTERSVRAQTSAPPVVVTTTQLGISPGAPTAAESREPEAPQSANPQAAAERKTEVAAHESAKTSLAEDADNLLKLANSLQSDVNKTTKDMLSVNVVREAGEIEQLAHRMRTR